MAWTKQSDCQITYQGNTVVILGSSHALSTEVHNILRRFANSGRPYYIAEQEQHRVVLRMRT